MRNCYYLFLDDKRTPQEAYSYKRNPIYVSQEWVVVKNYDEFIEKISERHAMGQTPCAVSLDHDLATEHYALGAMSGFQRFDENAVSIPTGWHCLKWLLRHLESNDIKMPEIILHSMNAGGIVNMSALIDEYKTKNRNV